MTIPHVRGRWRKSSRSQNTSSCVEVAVGPTVGVRDTKNRGAGHLTVSARGWSALMDAAKTGQLD